MTNLIQPQELHQKMNSDQPPLIIDVREEAAFVAGHIPGAFHIPVDEMSARMVEFPKDRFVVTY